MLAGLLAFGAVACLVSAVRLRMAGGLTSLLDAPSMSVAVGAQPQRSLPLTGLPGMRRLLLIGDVRGKLSAAGWKVDAEDIVVAKLVCALSAGLMVAAAGTAVFLVAPVAAAGGFVIPDLLMARSARSRRKRIEARVAQFLDLLAAASSSGLAASAAIGRAAAGMRGPLGEELAVAAATVQVGSRWRDELRTIADRWHLPDLRAAVTVIVRTESLGSSLADALRDLADDVREQRRARLAERARTAPVKMLFPLVFMILPAFLLLTVVPVLIATLRSLH